MVVVTNSGKGQQFLSIGNRDCTNIQLLIQHLCHFHAVHFVKPGAKCLPSRPPLSAQWQKSRSVFFKHRAFIEQYTHKQCRADGIGDHHWRSNITHQTHRIFIRSGDRRMINICTISATNVTAPAVMGLKTLSVRPRRIRMLCTGPPSNPSTMVEIMQLSAVMPHRISM